jgi:hypothetical protein
METGIAFVDCIGLAFLARQASIDAQRVVLGLPMAQHGVDPGGAAPRAMALSMGRSEYGSNRSLCRHGRRRPTIHDGLIAAVRAIAEQMQAGRPDMYTAGL